MKKVFDLNQLARESYAEGISALTDKKQISLRDVKDSRGEFIGYVSSNEEAVLFRDRIGGRVLYYAEREDKVYASDDIRWIADQVDAEPNLEYITGHYMEFQVPIGDLTFYRGIFRVQPGELIYFSKEKGRRNAKYWELKFNEKTFEPSQLRDLIVDAVEYRKKVIGDKYTAYLSGGLDSSTVTLLAEPEKVYSGIYRAEGYSERDYIESVLAKAEGLESACEVEINEQKFYKLIPYLPQILGDPQCGLGVIPQVIVAQQAREHGYKYSFTGEGGDEIFCGYNWNTLVFTMKRAAELSLRDRYMVRYEGMVEGMLHNGLMPMVAQMIRRGDSIEKAIEVVDSFWDSTDVVENNIMRLNVEFGLPSILTLDEAVGKFSGVEPVSPLMDHNIVEYVASINPVERVAIPKAVLRQAMKGILPEKVETRYDKMGFPLPADQWSWPMLSELLTSLKNRHIMKVTPKNHTTMDRKTWALCNIELFLREGEKK